MGDETCDSKCSYDKFDDSLYGLSAKNNKSSICSYTYCYEYDVFLVYDPDYDHVNAEEVLKIVEKERPKNKPTLKILNFARDCTPGVPAKVFFANALKKCRYTCVVFSSISFQKFWMKLKVDMAIQDMIQNEHKQYSLIVVVVDKMLKLGDLPLDLQTLCPILLSERYYEERLANAFYSSFLNPPIQSMQPNLSGLKDRFPIQESCRIPYESTSCNLSSASFISSQNIYPSSFFNKVPQNYKYALTDASNVKESTALQKSSLKIQNCTSSLTKVCNEKIAVSTKKETLNLRIPDEHSDFSSPYDVLSSLSSVEFEQQASIFNKPSGLRQPTEMDEVEPSAICDSSPINFSSTCYENLSISDLDMFTQSTPVIKPKFVSLSDHIYQPGTSTFQCETNDVKTDDACNSLENIVVEVSDEEISPKSTHSRSMNSLRSIFNKINSFIK